MEKIIIYILFAGVIILWAVLPSNKSKKKKRKKGGNSVDEQKYTMLINKVNVSIDRLNNLTNMYDMKAETLRNMILSCNDMAQMDIFASNVNDMGKYRISANEILERVNQASADVNVPEIERGYYALLDIIDNMECLKEQMEYITPTPQKQGYTGWQGDNANRMRQNPESNVQEEFFAGCATLEELQRRYHALTKAFHPDTGFGDEGSFERMQKEYEKKKGELS